MEPNKSIASALGIRPSIATILAYLTENRNTDHPASEIAEACGLSSHTAHVVLDALEQLDVVTVTRTISKLKFYAFADTHASRLVQQLFIHIGTVETVSATPSMYNTTDTADIDSSTPSTLTEDEEPL